MFGSGWNYLRCKRQALCHRMHDRRIRRFNLAHVSGRMWTHTANRYDIGIAGDVDGSGKIDLNDVILALQIVTGSSNIAGTVQSNGDINRDRRIGIEEAIFILQYISKEKNKFFLLNPFFLTMKFKTFISKNKRKELCPNCARQGQLFPNSSKFLLWNF